MRKCLVLQTRVTFVRMCGGPATKGHRSVNKILPISTQKATSAAGGPSPTSKKFQKISRKKIEEAQKKKVVNEATSWSRQRTHRQVNWTNWWDGPNTRQTPKSHPAAPVDPGANQKGNCCSHGSLSDKATREQEAHPKIFQCIDTLDLAFSFPPSLFRLLISPNFPCSTCFNCSNLV